MALATVRVCSLDYRDVMTSLSDGLEAPRMSGLVRPELDMLLDVYHECVDTYTILHILIEQTYKDDRLSLLLRHAAACP